MLFTELLHAIHPHLMKDAEVPDFMRDLIQRFCDIPEEEWSTKKDPSSDSRYKDASLYKFYKRGISKKLAKAMLGRMTKDNFVNSLTYINEYDENESLLNALAEDVQPFTDKKVTRANVAEVIFDLIKESLEFIVNPELENDRKMAKANMTSEQAKKKYGATLLEDCKHTCSKPGCSKHLQTVADDHQSKDDYCVAHISGNKNCYENLIPLCHDCFQSYSLKHTQADEKELQKIKQLQVQTNNARTTLRGTDIEKGIRRVLENLSRAKVSDFADLNYNAITVTKKIDQDADYFLLDEVMRNVTRYYLFIEKNMKQLVKQEVFSDELLRAQIKVSYQKLAKKNLPAELIYQLLAERLQSITKQDVRYCYIVISYFIQSCEVFDALTK